LFDIELEDLEGTLLDVLVHQDEQFHDNAALTALW
jgi:hypothetical protein